MNTTLPKDNLLTQVGIGIDPCLGAVTTTAPAVSKRDSCPQAILKFHRPSSLDYRARHGPPVHKFELKQLPHLLYGIFSKSSPVDRTTFT